MSSYAIPLFWPGPSVPASSLGPASSVPDGSPITPVSLQTLGSTSSALAIEARPKLKAKRRLKPSADRIAVADVVKNGLVLGSSSPAMSKYALKADVVKTVVADVETNSLPTLARLGFGKPSPAMPNAAQPKLNAIRMMKADASRTAASHVAKNARHKKFGATKKRRKKDGVNNLQTYRHLVSNKKFVLGHRSVKNRWTHWKRVMASQERYLTSPRVSRATKRHPDMVGFKKPKLFTRDEPGDRALYEVAVQKCHRGFLKKYVMFSKVCTINDWAKWDKVLLSKPYVQKQINHVIENGGLVWVRRFKLSGMGKRQKESVNKYLHGRMYKYAWNPKSVPQKPGKLSWAIQTC